MKKLIALMVLVLALAWAQDKPKVGFIYVGPVGDAGWTYAHDLGRQKLEQELGVETLYIESVPEADVESFIDQLVDEGASIIFTTSFGYGDGTIAAAERYPDVLFGHATGYMRAPNVMTYIAEMYQSYYINGLIAGALSESNKLGYIAAFPIPEVKRHIDAFAIGAKEVNPDAIVEVRWLFNWFDPAGAKEATEALIAEGADAFIFTEDTPTVIQTAAEKGYPSFSHYASMYDFSPDTVASGQLTDWGTIYIDFVKGVMDGTYTNENLEDLDYIWRYTEGASIAGAKPGMPINPVYEDALKAKMVNDPVLGEISVYDLVMKRIEQMTAGEFEPFTGPIVDRKGNVVYAEGEVATLGELMGLEWAADNVVGDWDNEP
ncbi:MAG: BMP family ABC transporter substrate-binding protein [Trueperaceae bacterium]|nr:BMP family ABC transporter substrate-binding protein [Trueperaceae bacterium]